MIAIEVIEPTKTPDELAKDYVIRLTLERAALRIERQSGNELYRKAWKIAAKLVRDMKPI
jgi:hypothetical protein